MQGVNIQLPPEGQFSAAVDMCRWIAQADVDEGHRSGLTANVNRPGLSGDLMVWPPQFAAERCW